FGAAVVAVNEERVAVQVFLLIDGRRPCTVSVGDHDGRQLPGHVAWCPGSGFDVDVAARPEIEGNSLVRKVAREPLGHAVGKPVPPRVAPCHGKREPGHVAHRRRAGREWRLATLTHAFAILPDAVLLPVIDADAGRGTG